jgi:hypothetical protein
MEEKRWEACSGTLDYRSATGAVTAFSFRSTGCIRCRASGSSEPRMTSSAAGRLGRLPAREFHRVPEVLEDGGLLGVQLGGALQGARRPAVLTAAELQPAQRIEVGGAVGLQRQRLADEPFRLVELLSAVGERVADEVQRRGVAGVERQDLPHPGQRLRGVAVAFVQGGQGVEQLLVMGVQPEGVGEDRHCLSPSPPREISWARAVTSSTRPEARIRPFRNSSARARAPSASSTAACPASSVTSPALRRASAVVASAPALSPSRARARAR